MGGTEVAQTSGGGGGSSSDGWRDDDEEENKHRRKGRRGFYMANNVTQLQQTVNNLGAIVAAIKKNEDNILKRVEKLKGNAKIIHTHDEAHEAEAANNGANPVSASGCSLPCDKAELIDWIQYAVHQEFFIVFL